MPFSLTPKAKSANITQEFARSIPMVDAGTKEFYRHNVLKKRIRAKYRVMRGSGSNRREVTTRWPWPWEKKIKVYGLQKVQRDYN